MIRVFIGTEKKTTIAAKVLEFSIRRRTNSEVMIVHMDGPEWAVPDDLPRGTGFSLRRWLIPSRIGYHGFAIYLDADQLMLSNIAELWAMDRRIPGNAAAWMTYQIDKSHRTPRPQSSVMLIDCEAAESQMGFVPERMIEHLRKHPGDYSNFMHATWMNPQPIRIPTPWNHLDAYRTGETKLIHYTREDEQPWYNPGHKYAMPWKAELMLAIRMGAVTQAELEEALSQWGVKADWRTRNGLHPDYRSFFYTPKRRGVKVARRQRVLTGPPARPLPTPVTEFGKSAARRPPFQPVWVTRPGQTIDPSREDSDGIELVVQVEKLPRAAQAQDTVVSQSFAKAAAIYAAIETAQADGFNAVIWVDPHYQFRRSVRGSDVGGWFNWRFGVFHLRQEGGEFSSSVLGINLLSGGDRVIKSMVKAYHRGATKPFDVLLQEVLSETKVKALDQSSINGRGAGLVGSALEAFLRDPG